MSLCAYIGRSARDRILRTSSGHMTAMRSTCCKLGPSPNSRSTPSAARKVSHLLVERQHQGCGPGVSSFFTGVSSVRWIDDVLYATHTAVGYPIPPGIQTVRGFDGHAYFDFSGMQWCVYDAFGVLPSETVKSIGGHQPEIPLGDENPLRGPAGKRRNKARLRLMKRMWGLDSEFKAAISRHFDQLGRIVPNDLTPLSRPSSLPSCGASKGCSRCSTPSSVSRTRTRTCGRAVSRRPSRR